MSKRSEDIVNDEYLLLKTIADTELDYIEKNGFAHAGCNGPYNNKDTAVRNSGHFLVIYSYLYEKTQNNRYLAAVKCLSDFLLRENNYGKSGSIEHRTDNRFDHTNGLIGQAWTIEALVEAYKLTKSGCAYEKAKQLFLNQRFNYDTKMWIVVDCDGTLSLDLTFNHQLWFAAAGAMLLDIKYDSKIDEEIKLFLEEASNKFFQVRENGRIVHVMNYFPSEHEKEQQREIIKQYKRRTLLKEPFSVIKKKFKDKLSKNSFTEGIEEGYHLFDLYGFAILYNRYSKLSIYSSEKFSKALDYMKNSDNILGLSKNCGGYPYNKFAYAYNSPAFEYPFVANTFSCFNDSVEKKLIESQCSLLLDASKGTFKSCDDPYTLNARTYELVRYFRQLENKDCSI